MNSTQRALHFKRYKKTGPTMTWQVKGAAARSPFFYDAGMSIDFDGAPDAYAPLGSGLTGKDHLPNAVAINDKQGRSPWLTPPKTKKDKLRLANNPLWTPTYQSTVRNPTTGASVEQTSGPTSGYYISESSLKDIFHKQRRGAQTDVEYQTNANVYPYLAMPGGHFADSGLKVSDYALAIQGQTGVYCFAVYGDAKTEKVLGESSWALGNALGVQAGIGRGIVYVVFPDTGLGAEYRCDVGSLQANGLRWLKLYNDRLDLVKHMVDCFSPEFPGVARAFRTMGL